jgi:hypothetical protein
LTLHAEKRRAVAHPAPLGDKLTINVEGVILDDATGTPVSAVRVTVGNRSDVTSTDGKFSAHGATGFGSIDITATRSGYLAKTVTVNASGDHTVTLRLTPTPTVKVTKTNASVMNVDAESVEFGYAVPFSGYRQYPYEDFCKGGTAVAIDRSEIKRIVGPATVVSDAPCCPSKNVLKINLELRTGEKTDVYFLDSCEAGVTRIDFIARDHTGGMFQYIPFTEITEVVFP